MITGVAYFKEGQRVHKNYGDEAQKNFQLLLANVPLYNLGYDALNYVYRTLKHYFFFSLFSGYMAVSVCGSSLAYNNTYIQNPGLVTIKVDLIFHSDGDCFC